MEPFLGEISPVAFSFAPQGWALCNGQLLPISQNQALFALLGTTFGGNGTTNFALPDLRGRIATAFGQGTGLAPHTLGESSGQETHTLTLNAMAPGGHSHAVSAQNNGNTGGASAPGGGVTLGAGYSS